MGRRLIRSMPLRLVLLAVAWAAVSMPLAWAVSAQEGPNRAALVVRFEDGSVLTQCISFSEPAISGTELLTRAGLQTTFDYNSGLGGAVCSLRDQGCAFPAEDCFCRCQGVECEYWAYYHGTDGRWQYSQTGASSHQVTDGAVEGWSWGPGSFSSGIEPPHVAFDEVCVPVPLVAAPVTASTEVRSLPVGSFLVPAVHAQGVLDAPSASQRYASSTPAHWPLLPNYAAYLLFATAMIGAGVWVLDRRKKAAAIAATARRDS